MDATTLNEIALIRLSICAVRERMNQDLNALEAKLTGLFPPEPALDPVKDWRKEVEGWTRRNRSAGQKECGPRS